MTTDEVISMMESRIRVMQVEIDQLKRRVWTLENAHDERIDIFNELQGQLKSEDEVARLERKWSRGEFA